MKLSFLAAVLLVLAVPAVAEVVPFKGYSVEIDNISDSRRVLAMRGVTYAIPGTSAQVIAKAQGCLAKPDSAAGVISTNPEGGHLVAISRLGYSHDGEQHMLKTTVVRGGWGRALRHRARRSR